MREKISLKYFLFSFSNLIAAFGGGMVLGKCVGIIENGFFQGDSVLAFFLGTVLGLVFLQLIPKKIAQNAGRWFAISGGFASIILLLLFQKFSLDGKLSGHVATLFFVVLSIRFGFWFYSRVLRASEAAGYKRRIAWVELGYYSGIIFGLIIWQFIHFQIEISSILLLDAAMQFIAGFIDYFCATKQPHNDKIGKVISAKKDFKLICWQLAIAIMLLTIGVQVVTFNLAHLASSTTDSSWILAIFYFGVAVAASIYKRLKVGLEWRSKRNHVSYAIIKINNYNVSLFSINFLSAILIFLAIIICFFYETFFQNIMLLAIFAAAFCYELLALAILDRIGFEEKSTNSSGMVIRAYGLMGIGAALSFWVLNVITSTSVNLIIMMIVCLSLSGFVLRRSEQ